MLDEVQKVLPETCRVMRPPTQACTFHGKLEEEAEEMEEVCVHECFVGGSATSRAFSG